MRCKVIAGSGSDYHHIEPQRVISIKDLLLFAKGDSVEKVSKAVLNGQLAIYYFHEIKKEEQGDKIVGYRLDVVDGWEFECTMQLERIFFLKHEVQHLERTQKIFTQQDGVLAVPEERITTERNVVSQAKETIMRSRRKSGSRESICYLFYHFVMTTLMKMGYLVGRYLKNLRGTLLDIQKIEGYDSDIFKDPIHYYEKLVVDNPWTTEEEREDLALTLQEQGCPGGTIGKLLLKGDDANNNDANRQRGKRLADRAKKRKKILK